MIELIEVLKAVLFGIVEGVTEWLSHQQYRASDSAE